MKITYRIPSKKVPYGYVEIEDDQSYAVMPGPDELAQSYAQYILDYQKAEVAAFEQPQKPKAEAKDEVAEAQKILSEGLGGVTEVDGDDPEAPWNNKTSDDTSPSEESEPQSDDDWDFDN